MAFTFSTNQIPATCAACIFLFKSTLKTAGWTVPSSSDGTTYNASGDQITTNTTGAGGMNNNFAWFILSQPITDGYQRHIAIQVNNVTAKNNVKIKLSWTGFNTGSPNATTMPTAADEQYIFGTSGAFAAFLDSTEGSIVNNVCAGGLAEKYHFYWYTTKAGTGGVGSLFLMDFANLANPLDYDPYVYYINGSSTAPLTSLNTFTDTANGAFQSSSGPYIWINKHNVNGITGSFGRSFISNFNDAGSSTYSLIAKMGTNPYDNNPETLPAFVVRVASPTTAAPYGIKGKLMNVLLTGTTLVTADTLTVSTSNDRVFCGPLVLIWDGSVPTV